MIFVPLSEDDTRVLEEETAQRIFQLFPLIMYNDERSRKVFNISSWHTYNNFKKDTSQKVLKSKLTFLLGLPPVRHTIYNGTRHAIWGLSWNGKKFILLQSIKGLEIKIANNFKTNQIDEFLDDLLSVLVYHNWEESQ